MELFLNDLSLMGQFQDVSSFQSAIRQMMRMRNVAYRFDRKIYCHRNITQAKATRELSLQQAVQSLDTNEKQALIPWLSQHGPFWDDDRCHQSDDYFQYKEDVVTDTALGEVAYRCFQGADHRLVSFTSSDWMFSPIVVSWFKENNISQDIEITNHWDEVDLEACLKAVAPPIKSWQQLEKTARSSCNRLTFSDDSFDPIFGFPFKAHRIKF